MNKADLKEAREKWEAHCRWIQKSTVGAFIGDNAEMKNERIAKALLEYEYFTQTYFAHYCTDKSGRVIANAPFHNEWANAVKANPSFMGVAEWPREHAKSVHNTIILPLWLLVNGELDGMILTSKSQDAAILLLSDIQAELKDNEKFIADFGSQYNEGSWEAGHFVTKSEVFFVAKGRGQSPRGIRYKSKRPNLGVADDLDDDEIVNNQHRVQRAVRWLLEAFVGALDINQSRFIMVGNRFHPKSILAHIVGDVEEGDPKREGLYHSKVMATTNGELNGPPTWKAKFRDVVLQARFKFIGTISALREFFHTYVLSGKLFKAEWIHWDTVPSLYEMDCMVVYFDPSYKSKSSNDYKAIRFWAKKGNKRYLVRSFVRQTTITQAVKWMYDLWEELPEDIRQQVEWWMEEVFLQDQFYEDFDNEAWVRGYHLPIRGDKRKKPDKDARIESMTTMYERDHCIWNIAEKRSPDFQNGLIQYMGFERGSPIHDDALDADEGANYKLNKRTYKSKYPGEIGQDENKNSW